MADFRPMQTKNGSFVLSGIQVGLKADDVDAYGDGVTRGQGLVLNDAYEQRTVVSGPAEMHSFNMHELKIVDGGQSALHILWKPEYIDVSELGLPDRKAGWVGNMGFREVDLESGNTVFEWWSLDHVPLQESSWPVSKLEGPAPTAWDYFHADSIDKSANGDYLLSARHTDCIYKISGQNHSVLWRLGGRTSSFASDEVQFARQHDARFVEAEDLRQIPQIGVEYMSLFDNSGDEYEVASASSALVIKLDLLETVATSFRRLMSPEEGTTRISGNSQILPNGNTLTCWGARSYTSEHSVEGRLVAEASFASDRFSNYRTYKAAWKASPSDAELTLKCFAWGTSVEKATTVCYVSWNGATEVDSWDFYRQDGEDHDSSVGVVTRTGFETSIQYRGYSEFALVKALDSVGDILATSRRARVKHPGQWS
ncbi:hypothetical protein LTR15_011109 [Elasticomyces elasticus]|nr:hypothetical protein LTR15_011109 [Elasticomyces elasticus]